MRTITVPCHPTPPWNDQKGTKEQNPRRTMKKKKTQLWWIPLKQSSTQITGPSERSNRLFPSFSPCPAIHHCPRASLQTCQEWAAIYLSAAASAIKASAATSSAPERPAGATLTAVTNQGDWGNNRLFVVSESFRAEVSFLASNLWDRGSNEGDEALISERSGC